MIYNNNGNVGIGTTSPARTLDVNGPKRMSTHLIFNSANAVINYSAAGSLFFRSNSIQGDDGTYAERMILTNAGSLGIGTTSPVTTLDVAGGIRTRYSGSINTGFPVSGLQTVNFSIPTLPVGWDFTNTVVLVTNADGIPAAIQQAKLLNLTTIQVTCNPATSGGVRLNWIVFKL